jgi:hypothetical protein
MNIILTVIYLFALASMGASICWLMLRANHSRMTYSFIGCQFMIVLWIVSQLLDMYALSTAQLAAGYAVGNLGICFIGTFWILFAMYYLKKNPPRMLEIVLAAFSVLMYAAAVSTSQHRLYYSEFSLGRVSYGVLFYLNQAYIYLCMILGIFMVCRQCFENRQRSRGQAVLLTFAAAVPLTVN